MAKKPIETVAAEHPGVAKAVAAADQAITQHFHGAETAAAAVDDTIGSLEVSAQPMLRVTSRMRHGFWRGGRSWPAGTAEVPVADLTPEQLDQVRGEPGFTVEIV